MFKIIKFQFFILLVLTGLYFFGNFRVNDVNVRDYLQQHLNPKKLMAYKDTAVKIYRQSRLLFDSQTQMEGNVTSHPIEGQPLESLTPQDQKQLLKMLEDHLKQQQNK